MWLLRDAYQLQDRQLLGLPGWAAAERFEETREGTVYHMVVAKEGVWGRR